MRLFFIVGHVRESLVWTDEALRAEHTVYGDIIISPFYESYANLPFKRLMETSFSSHISIASKCKFYGRVDPDTYLRPFQALKMLEKLMDTKKREIFVGHIWDGLKSGKPNVVHDPNSPWFLPSYPTPGSKQHPDFYPPYASGYCHFLSASLLARVAVCLQNQPHRIQQGPDDVQLGICVNAVARAETKIRFPKEMNYDVPCTELT
eukprot:UC4_evm1s93